MHTIEISEELYQLLPEQAVRLNLSPAQLIKRLVSGASEPGPACAAEQSVPPAGSAAAFANDPDFERVPGVAVLMLQP